MIHPWSDEAHRFDGVPFPCGQCLPCRINKRRIWTHRLLLELYGHEEACFLTMTYANEHLPSDHLVNKATCQKYLKRLRKYYAGRHIRYYLVGEYGGLYGRPHYHAILFGLPASEEAMLQKIWSFGRCRAYPANHDTIQYVAGYVVDKLAKNQGGTEFALMSRRPGIGFNSIPDLARALNDEQIRDVLEISKDVPIAIRHGAKLLPLGRYLRDKLYTALNPDAFVDNSDRTIGYFVTMQKKYLEFRQSGIDQTFVDWLSSQDDTKALRATWRQKAYRRRHMKNSINEDVK